MADQLSLLNLTRPQLEALLTDWGEPRFRADQVWGWLYRSLVADFDGMRNLPTGLRARLAAETTLDAVTPADETVSADRQTRKVLFALGDGETIESVLMRYHRRRTVCVSSQVGCAIGCPFCATGQGGFVRDLTAGEMVGQVLHFARQGKQRGQERPVTNVVFMGMGEPLANYRATWQAIETLADERGFNLGARHITVSTAGLVPGIEQLGREQLPVGLAVSLHAPSDGLRDELVPLNRRYPLGKLIPACKAYAKRTGRRITFEYALIDEVNDWPAQAKVLGQLLQGVRCHVNLIPVNPTERAPHRPSPRKRVNAFQSELKRHGIESTVRLGRGMDIQAGCGQLRSRQKRLNNT